MGEWHTWKTVASVGANGVDASTAVGADVAGADGALVDVLGTRVTLEASAASALVAIVQAATLRLVLARSRGAKVHQLTAVAAVAMSAGAAVVAESLQVAGCTILAGCGVADVGQGDLAQGSREADGAVALEVGLDRQAAEGCGGELYFTVAAVQAPSRHLRARVAGVGVLAQLPRMTFRAPIITRWTN